MAERVTTMRWQVQGTAAESYERHLVPGVFAPWVPRLLDAAGLQPGQRVLDVACGTGIVARGAAERVGPDGRVVGVDLNPGMIEAARAADGEGAIEWQQGDASALPFADGEFDRVLCQQGLQFVPDPARAAAEMRRVAGARTVVVAVWAPLAGNPVWAGFVAALDRHAGPDAAAIMRSPFGLGDAGRVREIFERAGFAEVQVEAANGEARFDSGAALVHAEAVGSPLAEPLGALDPDARAALVADVESLLEPYRDEAGVGFPSANHIVTARG